MLKKRMIAAILALLLMAGSIAGCSRQSGKTEDGKIRIGITIQSLKNAYWAGVMGKLSGLMEEKGYQFILVDCESNAATQIAQIENFIISGCDLIMVHPENPDSVEFVCKEARDAGISVMCWDDKMENTDVNWVLDNTALGEEIGKMAAEFINLNFTADSPAKTVVIGYPETPVLLERENGILQGLSKYCDSGKYTVTASIKGLEANEAQNNCETVMQAHPDAAVFLGIGAGAMIGANEALINRYGKGKIPENCGVFTTDVTMEQLVALCDPNQAVRGIIGFEGSSMDTAKACLHLFERILSGETFTGEARNIYREVKPITPEDAEAIIPEM